MRTLYCITLAHMTTPSPSPFPGPQQPQYITLPPPPHDEAVVRSPQPSNPPTVDDVLRAVAYRRDVDASARA